MTMSALNILLIEDNPADARVVTRAFARASPLVTVHHAQDGTEAMAMLRREGPFRKLPPMELVLLDLRLPGIDGFEVLSELRSAVQTRHLPVIVLTTSEDEREVTKAYELQANCFVTKPIHPEAFVQCVQAITDFWGTFVQYPSRRTAVRSVGGGVAGDVAGG